MIRLAMLCIASFSILANAVVKHGTVFPITETAQTYNTYENYYDSADTTEIRYSYTPAKTGYCRVPYISISYDGTDDSFSNKLDLKYINRYDYFFCEGGKTYYFSVSVDTSEYYRDYEIFVLRRDASIVSIQGNAEPDTVFLDSAMSIKAPINVGKQFVGWKIDSGTGTFKNSKNFVTQFTPTSEKVTLSYDFEDEVEKLYPLTEKFVSYSLYSNGNTTQDGYYGIKLVYEPSETGLYTLVTSKKSAFHVLYYGEDDTFATALQQDGLKTNWEYDINLTRSLTAGKKYYFVLASSRDGADTVSIKMVQSYVFSAQTQEKGDLLIDEHSYYGSSAVAVDSVLVTVYPDRKTRNRFFKWEKVSGSCSFENESKFKTKVYVDGECNVRPVLGNGSVYQITDSVKSYTPFEHCYYGYEQANGVRFFLFAPTSGTYLVKFEKDSSDVYVSLGRYKTRDFSNGESAKYLDTLVLSAGDSVFYEVYHGSADSWLMPFKISYEILPFSNITIESSSPECSANFVSKDILKGSIVNIEAHGKNGYRPDGWKFVSGSHNFVDSTAHSISIKLDADTKIKLGCRESRIRESRIIDITDKPKTYVIDNDFYGNSPDEGLRFRYVAPSSGLYVLRLQSEHLHGTYNFYGRDSLFSTLARQVHSISSSFLVRADSAHDMFYASVKSRLDTVYGVIKNYWAEPVSAVVLPAGTVKMAGNTKTDTIAIGDTLRVVAPFDSGAHFVKWAVESGKGFFIDSLHPTARFVLEESAVIKPVTTTLPLYELTEQYKGYTFEANSSFSGIKNNYDYGIRAFFKPTTDGMYTIQMKTSELALLNCFSTDSTFTNDRNCGLESYKMGVLNAVFDMKAGEKLYFHFVKYFQEYLRAVTDDKYSIGDSVWVRAVKNVKLRADTSGPGFAYVGSYRNSMTGLNYDSLNIAGAEVALKATPASSDFKFSKWTVVSGSCKIVDSTNAVTTVIPQGDCTVKAHFVPNKVYAITEVATKYTLAENSYSNSVDDGVRFSFGATSAGLYTFVFRYREDDYDYFNNKMFIERYVTGDYNTCVYKVEVEYAYSDYYTFNLSAGDSIFYIVKGSHHTKMPFWVNYSQSSNSMNLTTDGNGSVFPESGYSSVWSGAAYPITASGNPGFRFDKWVVESGKATIDDPNVPATVAYATESATIKALFKRNEIYALTAKKDTFNFQRHRYDDTKKGTSLTIRFSWTPEDTNFYMLKLDSAIGRCVYYGTDSQFSEIKKYYSVDGGSVYVPLQGEPGKTYYLSVEATYGYVVKYNNFKDKNFTAQIIVPNLMYVESDYGNVAPSNKVYVAPGMDTSLYVVPFGGYSFDSWTVVTGNVKIDEPSSYKARFEPDSNYNLVKAKYKPDSMAVPGLTISGFDWSGYPGVCAQVSVIDRNNGRFIGGLEPSNFDLYQDGNILSVQTDTIQKNRGVSVAFVVDEYYGRDSVKSVLRQFIGDMGPYDRASIVGMRSSNTRVYQKMTSDKDLLLNAVDSLGSTRKFGDTTGFVLGVEQVAGETNPTAVVIFPYYESVANVSEVVDAARKLNTTIYSIDVDCGISEPLIEIAKKTGGYAFSLLGHSQLLHFYSDIRAASQSHYVLCYQSPDDIWDGTSHKVEIKATFMGKTATATASWGETLRPPVVRLAPSTWNLVGVNQPQNKGFAIDVYAVSKAGVADVRLYARGASLLNKQFLPYSMTLVKDSLWRYEFPDSLVQYPGIDFYVEAVDSNGLVGMTPMVKNPLKEPYTIPVKNEVPVVTMDSLKCIDVSGKGKLRFKATDNDKVNSMSLYYKDSMAVFFDELSMKLSDGYWVASMPSRTFGSEVVEFYARAVDGVGASARWHKKENTWLSICGRKNKVPNIVDSLKIVNADTTRKIMRETDKLNLTLVTEDFTNIVDTVKVKLSCFVSGDVESNVALVEKRTGYYETVKPISKNEKTAVKDDGVISCTGRDVLVAEYKDARFGDVARDTVVIYIEDVEDVIKIVNVDSAKAIVRTTDKINLSLVTEDFTIGIDTVKVKLSCLVSGDVENNIALVEKRIGYYETVNPVSKNEKMVKKNDGVISCSGRDTLVAEYKDAIWDAKVFDTVVLGDSVTFNYKFLDGDGKKNIDSVETDEMAKFRIRLTSFSKSVHVKDTLDVLLLNDKGDSLWVKAIETDNYSSTFEYNGKFVFAYDKKDLQASRLDALFDPKLTTNRVTITAKVKGDKLGGKRDSLIVYSNYVAADVAEIYDADKDGRADSIRIHFAKPNKDGIERVDTLYWNKAGGAWYSIAGKNLHIAGDGSWVEGVLKESFDYGVTFADPSKAPYLKMTKLKGGFSQKVKVEDKVGAVPVKAVKRPGKMDFDDYMESPYKMPPDTLEITLSEPVKTGKSDGGKKAEWKNLFTYSTDCEDSHDRSFKVSKLIETDSSGLVWTFVLDDYKIAVGNCIRANPDAPYVDDQKNPMGRGGVKVEGEDGSKYLYEVVPTPVVSGVESDAEWIAPGENEWSRVPDSLSVIKVTSVMPFKADVIIYDGLSNVVASFTSVFGEKGEMKEKIRENAQNRAKTGFIHWNNRSDKGRLVGSGVYIWRIKFKFKDGHSEILRVKSGVKRKK